MIRSSLRNYFDDLELFFERLVMQILEEGRIEDHQRMLEYQDNRLLFDIIEHLERFGQVNYELSSLINCVWPLAVLHDLVDVRFWLALNVMLQLVRNAFAVPEQNVECQQLFTGCLPSVRPSYLFNEFDCIVLIGLDCCKIIIVDHLINEAEQHCLVKGTGLTICLA